jgi:hypothetical protein
MRFDVLMMVNMKALIFAVKLVQPYLNLAYVSFVNSKNVI